MPKDMPEDFIFEDVVLFEEDEPIDEILVRWNEGEKGWTAPPHEHHEKDDLYDVWWRREGEDEIFFCSRLTVIRFVRRLIAAHHNFGEITIVKVERAGSD